MFFQVLLEQVYPGPWAAGKGQLCTAFIVRDEGRLKGTDWRAQAAPSFRRQPFSISLDKRSRFWGIWVRSFLINASKRYDSHIPSAQTLHYPSACKEECLITFLQGIPIIITFTQNIKILDLWNKAPPYWLVFLNIPLMLLWLKCLFTKKLKQHRCNE